MTMEEKPAVTTSTASSVPTSVSQQNVINGVPPPPHQWMYNYASMYTPYGYGMSPQSYTPYQYYPYHMMNYQYAQVFKPPELSDKKSTEKNAEQVNPPLPPGPPPSLPPAPQVPTIQKPPQFYPQQQKQFGNIRFNLNTKRLPNGVASHNSVTSGAAKKKRKRNKNNQIHNMGFPVVVNFQPVPPLPPPELNDPKPAPPPENLPPLPPPSTMGAPVPPPPPPPVELTATPKIKPLPNPLTNPTEEWPDTLKDYIRRCYDKCKTKIDRDQVDIVLKGIFHITSLFFHRYRLQ